MLCSASTRVNVVHQLVQSFSNTRTRIQDPSAAIVPRLPLAFYFWDMYRETFNMHPCVTKAHPHNHLHIPRIHIEILTSYHRYHDRPTAHTSMHNTHSGAYLEAPLNMTSRCRPRGLQEYLIYNVAHIQGWRAQRNGWTNGRGRAEGSVRVTWSWNVIYVYSGG